MQLIEDIKEIKTNGKINNYTKLFSRKLYDNKNILKEAFVKYYGEEYRNIITERLNNTFIYTFVSDATIRQLKELIITNFINNDIIVSDIKKIAKHYDKNHITAKLYCNGEDVQGESTKKFVTAFLTNEKYSTGTHIVGTSNNNIQTSLIFISFSQYFYDETTLIHELNHAIRSSDLAIYLDNNNQKRKITKEGLSINTASNGCAEIEEIIQHKIALEILDSFHKLGGCISMQPTIHLKCEYEKMFPLIEPFYQKYKALLKKVAMTDNMNALFSKIDKDKYEEYKKIIHEQFSIFYDNNKISDETINYINSLVNQMDKKESKDENIHELIEELKAKGKTIKFLKNNIIEDNNECKNKQR